MNALTTWLRRWRDTPARDIVSGLVLTAVLVAASYGEAHPTNPADLRVNGHPVPHTPDAALLLVVLATLVLTMRGRYPVTVLAVSTAAVATYSLLGYVNGAVLLAPAIALYGAARTVTVRQALAAAAITLLVLMGSTGLGNPFGATGGGFFLIPAMVAAPLFGGIAVSNRRAYIASIQARADDEARRRVDEERLRIARELHDVVAHTMSTINVQAAAAGLVLTDRPEVAAQALAAIRAASKNGLHELRAILNVLRQADDADPTSPAPGLTQLDALIASAAQAGLPTTVRVTGEAAPLPAAVDLAAYRIIQESLTNVIRHAGPATATVAVTYQDHDLVVEVTDTGKTASQPVLADGAAGEGAGHGLSGMRERAAAAGGTVQAGPAAAGGYRVVATLPRRGPDDPAQPDERSAPADHAAGLGDVPARSGDRTRR